MLAKLAGHAGVLRYAVFSPTDELIATVSDDSTARLYRVIGLMELARFLSSDATFYRYAQ